MREPRLLQSRDDLVGAAQIHRPGREVVAAADGAAAADLHERHGLGVAGLEAHRRAGGDVEAAAVRQLAVERELGVRLNEVVVAADLDGAVPLARDLESDAAAALVESHAPLDDDHGTGGVGGIVCRGRGRREDVGRRRGQEAAVQRLGEVPVLRRDGIVHRHQVRADGERALDLDLVQRAHDGRQHVAASQHRRADGHEVRHRVPAIADQLLQIIGDEGLERQTKTQTY